MPVAREYDPELVLVSAGFDSAAGDEEGFQVTPKGYASLTTQLRGLAKGRVVVVLEGGYNIPAVSHGLHACVASLAGAVTDQDQAAIAAISGAGASGQSVADMESTIEAQRPHWGCLAAS